MSVKREDNMLRCCQQHLLCQVDTECLQHRVEGKDEGLVTKREMTTGKVGMNDNKQSRRIKMSNNVSLNGNTFKKMHSCIIFHIGSILPRPD